MPREAGAGCAYDGAHELVDPRDVPREGTICDGVGTTLAAEGVALAEGEAAAAGMHAHHIFSQAA